jgi:hypothetical protein
VHVHTHTHTHRLNTYFSQTALTSQSVYSEEDQHNRCKNHDISYISYTLIIAPLPHIYEVPGSNLSMRTAMLIFTFHIVPQPRKVITSTVTQHRSQLFPNISFAVALISHVIQKDIFNMELSTSGRNYVLHFIACSLNTAHQMEFSVATRGDPKVTRFFF